MANKNPKPRNQRPGYGPAFGPRGITDPSDHQTRCRVAARNEQPLTLEQWRLRAEQAEASARKLECRALTAERLVDELHGMANADAVTWRQRAERAEARLRGLEAQWCIEGDYVYWPADSAEPQMAECPVAQAVARIDAALAAEQSKRLAAEACIIELEAELATWRSNATPG